PFLQGGKGCARLITTRRFDVAAEARARRVDVDEMTADESVRLLTARLDPPPTDPAPFCHLARRLGEWPLMLELVGAALFLRVERGDTPERALAYVNRGLDHKGVRAFSREKDAERHRSITRTIEVSLDLLEPDDRQRFTELAI